MNDQPTAPVDQVTPPVDEGSAMSESQVKEAAIQGVRWFSVTLGLAQLTTIGAAIILARLVSPSEFGRLAVALIVSEFALMIANETIGTPLVQRPAVEREHLEAATLLAVMIGLGLALLTLFVVPLITTPLFGAETSQLFRLFSPAFAITGILIVPLARLQRRLEFRRIGIAEVIGVLVSSAVSVLLASFGLGAKAYVLGVLAGLMTASVGYLTAAPPLLPRWRPHQMRELLGFGVPATAAGFAGVWYRNIDYMILGARLPSVIVGFYYRAFTVGVEYERRLSGIVARVAFPVYARTNDPAARLAIRERIVRVNVALVYPMLAIFIALAPTLVPWLFGERWAPAVLPAQILAVAGMASCVRSLTGPTVLAAGRPRALFLFSLCETVAYGVTVFAASSHGLTDVCIAVSVFQVTALFIAYTVLMHTTAGMSRTQIFHDLGPAVLGSAVLLGVGLLLRRALATALPAPVLCVLVGMIGGLCYLLALRFLSAAAWADVTMLARRLLPGRVARLLRLSPRPADLTADAAVGADPAPASGASNAPAKETSPAEPVPAATPAGMTVPAIRPRSFPSGEPTERWLLFHGDQLAADLVVETPGFNWLRARVYARPPLNELRPIFDDEIRLLRAGSEMTHSADRWRAWHRAWDQACWRIRSQVRLVAPDGREVHEFLLHIDGEQAWWRWNDDSRSHAVRAQA